MIQLTFKIEISNDIFQNEYAYMYGDKKNDLVTFVYCHKSGKEIEILMTYSRALSLALERSKDGRYKNYTYYIY